MKLARCIVSAADHRSGKERGDCWRACVASVLELPPAEVPNFSHLAREGFLDATREWLAVRGWAVLEREYGAAKWPFEKLIDWLASTGPGIAFIVCGEGGGEPHAVVALDGQMHDPSDCGIGGPHPCDIEGCDCEGFWWVYVIAPNHAREA